MRPCRQPRWAFARCTDGTAMRSTVRMESLAERSAPSPDTAAGLAGGRPPSTDCHQRDSRVQVAGCQRVPTAPGSHPMSEHEKPHECVQRQRKEARAAFPGVSDGWSSPAATRGTPTIIAETSRITPPATESRAAARSAPLQRACGRSEMTSRPPAQSALNRARRTDGAAPRCAQPRAQPERDQGCETTGKDTLSLCARQLPGRSVCCTRTRSVRANLAGVLPAWSQGGPRVRLTRTTRSRSSPSDARTQSLRRPLAS